MNFKIEIKKAHHSAGCYASTSTCHVSRESSWRIPKGETALRIDFGYEKVIIVCEGCYPEVIMKFNLLTKELGPSGKKGSTAA